MKSSRKKHRRFTPSFAAQVRVDTTNPVINVKLTGFNNHGDATGITEDAENIDVAFGIPEEDVQVDQIGLLMDEALDYAVLLPWAAGVMTFFEYELYEKDLPKDQFNAKWWELKRNLQGIVPPAERGEQYCDAASKTHINDDPAQYYDYAVAQILVFQFHNHIAKNILPPVAGGQFFRY